MRVRLGSIAALLAALMAAVLTACGSEDLSPRAAVAEAASKTAEAGSSRVAYSATMSGGQLAEEIELEGEGTFDYRRRVGEMRMQMPAPIRGEMRTIVDGLVLYMQFPPEMRARLRTEKPWLKLDLAKAGDEMGLDLDALMQTDQGDPTQTLNYLRAASDEVEEVGEEEIRGTETTHLRATVDFDRALEGTLEGVPAGERERVRESFRRIVRLTGLKTMPMDVWIDGEGRARRIAMDYEMELPATGRSRMQMAFDYFDFGVDVDVEPPPAGQVMDLTKLVGEGG
jgi:hypothetical protein